MFTNYTELKTEAEKWSGRSDVSIDMDTYIRIAETWMFNNPDQTLTVNADDTQTTTAMDAVTPSRYLALPTGFISPRSFTLIDANENRYKLTYLSPDLLNVRSGTGCPRAYTVTSRLEFDINPDYAYEIELDYFKRFVQLSNSNPTNSVITNAPNLYLFGTLWAIKTRFDEDDVDRYYQMFMAEIRGFNRTQEEARINTAPVMTTDQMIV